MPTLKTRLNNNTQYNKETHVDPQEIGERGTDAPSSEGSVVATIGTNRVFADV